MVKTVEDGPFQNIDDWQKQYMKVEVAGCSKFHVFECSVEKPYDLYMYRATGAKESETICENLVKKDFHSNKWASKFEQQIKQARFKIKNQGLKDIKWKEMYDDWRHFIPVERRTDHFAFCVDPGKKRRDDILANRKLAAKARMERTATSGKATAPKKKPALKAKLKTGKAANKAASMKSLAPAKRTKSSTSIGGKSNKKPKN